LTPPPLSIVVLPFPNLSDDHEQEYFADGVVEDLTIDLSRIEQMFVVSHNTVAQHYVRLSQQAVDTKLISRELGVRYVLEGSVQRSRHQLRVSAQLSNAESAESRH
jgi:adenylate cyclase